MSIFSKYENNEIRGICKQTIESLEYWLRHIVNERMFSEFGNNYLNAMDNGGSMILSQNRINQITSKHTSERERFTRPIDAAFLDDLIYIICHPNLYNRLFANLFIETYPNGANELRNVLNQLIEPRNRLSHSNLITHRQAEKVICYSHDIIDSIKEFYRKNNMHMDFNVPRFIYFRDSIGNEIYFDKDSTGNRVAHLKENSTLRSGDIIELEIEIDESFETNEYSIEWRSPGRFPNFANVKKISLELQDKHIGESVAIQCVVTSKKEWHRQQGYDDLLTIYYKILPKV